MGLVSGIVVFCCLWWIIFFMIVSKDYQKTSTHINGQASSAPESFSFKKRAKLVTLIALVLLIIIELILHFQLLDWLVK